MRPLVFAAAFIIAPVLGAASSAGEPAQVVTTRSLLQGRVLDTTGMPISGARVTAVPEKQLAGPSTLTDERGEFALALDAGPHIVTVGASGFLDVSEPFNVPRSGQSQSREFVLQVAGPRETVTVSAPAPYQVPAVMSATKTLTPLRDVPQSVTVVTRALIKDQMMLSVGDVVRYVPGIAAHQGEGNRDQVIIRGNSSSADFYVNGVRDDVQYYRDLYNLERVEALKGSNALIFGRGGGGGVINRVTKEAGFESLREITWQSGAYNYKRFTTDFDQPLTSTAALRVNGMFESSDSFRRSAGLERYGVSPAFTITPSQRTKIALSYEYFRDRRVADRGISSYQGRPADVDISTFYGNPADSYARARVNLGMARVEHQAGRLLVRNHTLFGSYVRSYQNYVPGAVTADKSQVALTSYNNATDRLNVFNQTDFTYAVSTGRFRHVLLAGVEIGRQFTDNLRNTGFFGNTATSVLVPYDSPTSATPVTFRQSATDADNHVRTNVAATYGQDQIQLSRTVQAVVGLRLDRFDVEYHNNRNGDTLARADSLISPRVGVIFKPSTPVSLYTSYSVSYLPGSGDQFASLTVLTQQLEPEKFSNYEVGLKWDAYQNLSLTSAVYRLDRTNTRSTDPNDPTRIVQTGSQTTNGYELGLNGRLASAWSVAGGYAYQDAFVARATITAAAGATVAQVPRHTFSLWNNYQVRPRLGAGLGVVYRTEMYAAIDNTVTVPGYTRVDSALYYSLGKDLRLQMNVENLFNTTYYVNADSNTNISPGVPRAIRVGLTTAF